MTRAAERSHRKPARLEHLDALRGAAAFLVLAEHLRNFLFTSFGTLRDPGLAAKLFYAMTSFGHQAVIVFFAMSGYLVGGKALGDMLSGRWSWRRYLLRRMTRLELVAVPALAATFVLDRLGSALSGGIGYDGSLHALYVSTPGPAAPLDHSIATLLGNLAFLQTVSVPVFGSNGPTWSLANEFWYYLVFPLAAAVVLVRHPASIRLILGVLALCAAFMLPWWLLLEGLIWVAGATGAWAAGLRRCRPILVSNSMRALVLGLCPISLLLTKFIHNALVSDLQLGFCIALALPVLAAVPSFGRIYGAAARGGAEISYTLYLSHFPLLMAITMVGFAPERFPPGLTGGASYLLLLAAAILWAVALWWCFERNTDRVYGGLLHALERRRRPAGRESGAEAPLAPAPALGIAPASPAVPSGERMA